MRDMTIEIPVQLYIYSYHNGTSITDMSDTCHWNGSGKKHSMLCHYVTPKPQPH